MYDSLNTIAIRPESNAQRLYKMGVNRHCLHVMKKSGSPEMSTSWLSAKWDCRDHEFAKIQ